MGFQDFEKLAGESFSEALKTHRQKLAIEYVAKSQRNPEEFERELTEIMSGYSPRIDVARRKEIEKQIQSLGTAHKPWTFDSGEELPTSEATETELAKVIGASEDVYYKLESGKQLPNIAQVIALAAHLDVDISTLLMPTVQQIDQGVELITSSTESQAITAGRWALWLKGVAPLPNQNARKYLKETTQFSFSQNKVNVRISRANLLDHVANQTSVAGSELFSGLQRFKSLLGGEQLQIEETDYKLATPIVLHILTILAGVKSFCIRYLLSQKGPNERASSVSAVKVGRVIGSELQIIKEKAQS